MFPNLFIVFSGKCETSLYGNFGQQWLSSGNVTVDPVFAQSLSYCCLTSTDLRVMKPAVVVLGFSGPGALGVISVA